MLWSVVKFLLGLALLAGCQARPQWPAHVVALEDFSDNNSQKVVESIRRLNKQSDRTLVLMEDEASPGAYPVSIQQHEPWKEEPTTAGLTFREEKSCRIALSTELFKESRLDYIDSVVWHEIGHCAGLGHNPKEGTLMFATARPFSRFSADALHGFFADVENLLWSEPLGH